MLWLSVLCADPQPFAVYHPVSAYAKLQPLPSYQQNLAAQYEKFPLKNSKKQPF